MISGDAAASRTWDLIVIGAGPSGAVAARQSALAGLGTLLIDAKAFPRDKVCGGCLNARATETLRRLGLNDIVLRTGGIPVREFQIVAGRRSVLLDLPAGAAISRSTFDLELVHAAIDAGARFLPQTAAVVEPTSAVESRTVSIRGDSSTINVQARVVIAADGLLRSSVKHLPGMSSRVAVSSRLGMGAQFVDDGPSFPAGRITMIVTRAGYVGLARVEAGRLNVAAALDPRATRGAPSMSLAIKKILEQDGQNIPSGLEGANWHGTPLLTSQPRCVAAERLFLIGDSAGYVEPFTGEGMATALEAAVGVTPLVVRGVQQWSPDQIREWTRLHAGIDRSRQCICRSLALLLRRPWTVALSIQACRWFPAIPRQLISRINRPSTLG